MRIMKRRSTYCKCEKEKVLNVGLITDYFVFSKLLSRNNPLMNNLSNFEIGNKRLFFTIVVKSNCNLSIIFFVYEKYISCSTE